MANGFPVKANYATGDVLTATNMNELSATLNYLQYMPPRNPVLNSNFSVWQRNTSFTTTGTIAYTADRWCSWATAVGSSIITTRDTSAPTGFQYSAKIRRSTSNADTGFLDFFQSFETVNSIPFAGKTVTLSFYAKAGANFSAASSILVSNIAYGTGTDQIYYNYTGKTDLTQNNTLTTSWQRFTHTVSVPSTATELTVLFYYTPVGTAGADDSFYVTGVQLELGSAANTYMPNQPTYQGELAACQRYYIRLTADNNYTFFSTGDNYSTTQLSSVIQLPVQLRTTPSSIETTGTASNYRVASGASSIACNSVPALDITGNRQIGINAYVASGLTVGYGGRLGANNTTSAYIGISAEL